MTTVAHELETTIDVGKAKLPGVLATPPNPIGLVVFAHGSGSGRQSPRNLLVSSSLLDRRCATFLFDLLSVFESHDRRNVFNIELLADRMLAATNHVRQFDEVKSLPLGFFGASTGAAAALVAAAELGEDVAAVVSRGGRPDLAGQALPRVTAPTLLIVGSLDDEVIELNRQAQALMQSESTLVIIEGASHLFEEPGTLEQVARLAGDWFSEKLTHSKSS